MSLPRRILVGILAAVPTSGAVLAGEPDGLLSRLANSPLLTPRFSHLESATVTDLSEREALPTIVPILQTEQRRDPRRPFTTHALAIEWQHSLNASQRLSLSAQYSDQVHNESTALAGTGSGATLGLTQQFGRDTQLSGQLFLGDEDMKARANGYGARRYYGMMFEGRASLWRDHTPFASLSWQRSEYDGLEGVGSVPASGLVGENVSRFAAGWAWKVLPGLDVRAEAQYRLTDEVIDPADQDRLQFYFRSTYGFR